MDLKVGFVNLLPDPVKVWKIVFGQDMYLWTIIPANLARNTITSKINYKNLCHFPIIFYPGTTTIVVNAGAGCNFKVKG